MTKQGHTVSSPLPTWDLSDLVKHPLRDFTRLSRQLEASVERLEQLRDHLTPSVSSETFQAALDCLETIAKLSAKLGAFAHLWFAENTKNQEARAFESRVRERLTQIHTRTLFFQLWWQSLDDEVADKLLPYSGDTRYYLDTLRRLRRFRLSEPEERVLSVKNSTGREALDALYGVFTSGLTFRLRIGSRVRALTREQLMAYVQSPDARLRKAAYDQLLTVYASQRDVLGEMYRTVVQDWKNEFVALRGYPSPMAVRNFTNDIPEEAVEALLRTCRSSAKLFQRYFRLKAAILNKRTLSRYDLYAPTRTSLPRISFRRAQEMVIGAYRRFSPQFAQLITRVLEEHHLDAHPRPGKMSGAFCYSVLPRLTPYVLVNFTGRPRDVATLAHELGHALHGLLARDRSLFTFHPSLPLAETASVFGEQLLMETLLNQERRKHIRQALLVAHLDDLYATVIRQAYFVEFERLAHRLAAEGATLDRLADQYLALLHEQFGEALHVPEIFRWEWLTIPHIFASPFYCYAYSFGNLLALALYRQYQQEGPAFVPRYGALLAAGGSQSPEHLLRPLGVDITTTAFWEQGFHHIRTIIDELERTV
ncbi:MAG: oligoendopeptidase F [Nitrospirae bacterium]|nr:MAG: oligoendopeptidase F [Nitrospirota bacterium]